MGSLKSDTYKKLSESWLESVLIFHNLVDVNVFQISYDLLRHHDKNYLRNQAHFKVNNRALIISTSHTGLLSTCRHG